MKIYKIRAWVNQNKKGRNEHPHYFETVVIDNLETAKRLFGEQKSEVRTWEGLKNVHSVKVDLFIPEIHKDGTLAYYPTTKDGLILTYNPNNL